MQHGATVQTALNILLYNGYRTDNLMFVRYPTLNRVAQMLKRGHGAPDTRQFFSYIHGLLLPTTYSKIKPGTRDYYDELSVFDENETSILGWLGKNKNYSPGSKVDKYMKKFEEDQR